MGLFELCSRAGLSLSLYNSSTRRGATPTKLFPERLAQPFDRSIPDSVAAELNAKMTFKPTLVSKPSRNRSQSPNGRASDFKSVHEHLYKEGEARKKANEVAAAALKEENETSFTFSPEINHRSKEHAADVGPV
mmetsp:Transcript_14575/g.24229  ORF Transcript_14575/g.24229 Transcript_14575/m.24229 type:complete len:134 (-) Transcript_14575:446-847(-)